MVVHGQDDDDGDLTARLGGLVGLDDVMSFGQNAHCRLAAKRVRLSNITTTPK